MKTETGQVSGRIRGWGIAVAALIVAGAASGTAGAGEMDLVFMKDWAPHGMHAPFYLAEQKGWYKEAGINVKIVDGKGSTSTVGLVAAGNADVGQASLSVMAIARSKGLPVMAIASTLRINEVGVVISKGAGMTKPADFKGKLLVYTAGSIEAPFIDSFLSAGGLSRRDVKLLAVDASAKVGTYLSGKGDGVIGPIPFFQAIAWKARPSDAVRFADFGLPMLSWGIIAHEDAIKNKGKALKIFNAVNARAWKYILDGNLDEAVTAIQKSRPGAKVSMAAGKGIFNAYRPYFYSATTKGRPMGYQSAKDWSETVATLKGLGLIDKGSKAKDYYTTAFMPQ